MAVANRSMFMVTSDDPWVIQICHSVAVLETDANSEQTSVSSVRRFARIMAILASMKSQDNDTNLRHQWWFEMDLNQRSPDYQSGALGQLCY